MDERIEVSEIGPDGILDWAEVIIGRDSQTKIVVEDKLMLTSENERVEIEYLGRKNK